MDLEEEMVRQALWKKALALWWNSKLLDSLKQHVEIDDECADEDTVISKIAEEMDLLHSELSNDIVKRPAFGITVVVNASVYGERKAQLIKCAVEAVPLKCRIIH